MPPFHPTTAQEIGRRFPFSRSLRPTVARASTVARACLLVLACLGLAMPRLGAAQTNAPASSDPAALARRIAERNIFDPDRQPRIRGDSRPAPKPRPVAAADAAEFGLVGVLSYARGTFAFFDGNDPEYRKTLAVAATIAGHAVDAISPQSVTLVASNLPPVQLRVGQRLRRDPEGHWQPVASTGDEGSFSRGASSRGASGTLSGSSSGSGAGTAAAGAEDPPGSDEILKRLLKKREQEMK